jgi:type IV pilus assembly protein PilA
MTNLPTDTSGKYVTQIQIANGRIDITYGNNANAVIGTQVLSLTPYETPDLSVAWRCGNAAQPAGTALLGTAGMGTVAAYAAGSLGALQGGKYLPSSCRTGN